MKTRVTIIVVALVMAMMAVSWAQDKKATVDMGNLVSFKHGETIVFKIKFNEPLPIGTTFNLQIQPITNPFGECVYFKYNKAVDSLQTDFQVSDKLPENAWPGEWLVTGISLSLPGPPTAVSTITLNPPLKFNVEGKQPYQVPTSAKVTVEH